MVAALLGVTLMGCTVSTDDANSAGGDTLSTAAVSEATTGPEDDGTSNQVGGSDDSGGFLFTVHQVVDPWTPAQSFVSAAPGMRYLAVELSAENQGGEVQTFSSLLGVELRDSLDRVWESTFTMLDPGMAGVDGEVQPGQANRGWFAAEVPADAQLVELRLRGNLTAAGAVWSLTSG